MNVITYIPVKPRVENRCSPMSKEEKKHHNQYPIPIIRAFVIKAPRRKKMNGAKPITPIFIKLLVAPLSKQKNVVNAITIVVA